MVRLTYSQAHALGLSLLAMTSQLMDAGLWNPKES